MLITIKENAQTVKTPSRIVFKRDRSDQYTSRMYDPSKHLKVIGGRGRERNSWRGDNDLTAENNEGVLKQHKQDFLSEHRALDCCKPNIKTQPLQAMLHCLETSSDALSFGCNLDWYNFKPQTLVQIYIDYAALSNKIALPHAITVECKSCMPFAEFIFDELSKGSFK